MVIVINTDDIIKITALHADNTAYRWWQSRVEFVSPNCIVTLNKIGDLVYEPDGNWEMNFNSRSFYWMNLEYNLLEIYTSGGQAGEIYLNIASPFQLDNKQGVQLGSYYDYELDVSKMRGSATEILDEDEFESAIKQYKYSASFVNECKNSLAAAVSLAERWAWSNNVDRLVEFGVKE